MAVKSVKKIEQMSDANILKRVEASMKLETPKLKMIPYLGRQDVNVIYKTSELIALCPMTDYPDLYDINIDFIPDKLVPELKSLKFYFMFFKDKNISHEHLASKIYDDFIGQVKPIKAKLHLVVAPRGGIVTEVTV